MVSAIPSMPLDRHRLAHQHRVKPAAAPRATGIGAELVADAAEPLADLVMQFGRKRAFANARRVGLGDAQHIAGRARSHARTRRRLPRHRVGRSDIRIGAVIDIEHRALRAFEQHALAALHRLIDQPPRRLADTAGSSARCRAAARADPRRSTSGRSSPRRSGSWCASRRSILPVERLFIGQIGNANGAAADFVFIGRADAAPGRADPIAAPARGFARAIEIAVQRQDRASRYRRPPESLA